MLTWSEAPLCLRYKVDGQLCGAPATAVDPECGISVCTAHVHKPAPPAPSMAPAANSERTPRVLIEGPLPVAATLDCGCRLPAGALAFEVESKNPAGIVWRESACRRHAAIIGAIELLRAGR